MTVQHIAMVYDAGGLSASEKHLLGAYCNHTDAHGYCWPGVERLADETGMSPRTVKRVNSVLRQRGLIRAVNRKNPRTGQQITNLTRVNLPLLASLRRPPRDYGDNLVEEITFDDHDEPAGQAGCQSDTRPGANLTPPGCQNDTPGGDNLTPKPSEEPSEEPSSPPTPPPGADGAARGADPAGREEQNPGTGRGADAPAAAVEEDQGAPVEGSDDVRDRAERIVTDALRRWHSDHRAPTTRDRARLVDRVAQELAAGGDETVILDELTRDLPPGECVAVRVVLGHRTRTPGWGRSADPRPERDRYRVREPRRPWCGVCDESTRMLTVRTEDPRTGALRDTVSRCDCPPRDADGRPIATGGAEDAADAPTPHAPSEAPDAPSQTLTEPLSAAPTGPGPLAALLDVDGVDQGAPEGRRDQCDVCGARLRPVRGMTAYRPCLRPQCVQARARRGVAAV